MVIVGIIVSVLIIMVFEHINFTKSPVYESMKDIMGTTAALTHMASKQLNNCLKNPISLDCILFVTGGLALYGLYRGGKFFNDRIGSGKSDLAKQAEFVKGNTDLQTMEDLETLLGTEDEINRKVDEAKENGLTENEARASVSSAVTELYGNSLTEIIRTTGSTGAKTTSIESAVTSTKGEIRERRSIETEESKERVEEETERQVEEAHIHPIEI